MTAQPLRNDNVYPLRMEDAIGVGDVQPDSIQPASSTLAGALAINEEEAKPKKKGGRPKGSKNAGKAKKAKSAKAKLPPPPVDSVPETQAPVQSLRIAAGGEGMLSRLKRVHSDDWLMVVYIIAALALFASLAFLTGAVKL